MKRVIAATLSLLLCFCAVRQINAASTYRADYLSNCKSVNADSNDSGAFAYGFKGSTLYSVMLMPDFVQRKASVEGNIISVCQDGKYTCALTLKTVMNGTTYTVTRLDMTSGNYKSYDFKGINALTPDSFAVCGDKAYFIRADAVYTYVSAYYLSGAHYCDYSFTENTVVRVFNNNSKVYAFLYDGSIYRVSGKSASRCVSVHANCDFSSSGGGWIATDYGSLVSLDTGKELYVNQTSPQLVAISNGNIKYASGSEIICKNIDSGKLKFYDCGGKITAVLAYKNKTALIDSGFNCAVLSDSDFTSPTVDSPTSATIATIATAGGGNSAFPYLISTDNVVFGIESGTTVTQFKDKISGEVTLKDKEGNTVTSGKIKTGMRLVYKRKEYRLSVLGDVTGEGNVKQNDESLMINYLLGGAKLSGEYKISADYNMDGTVDNRDLVLISRKARG